MASKIAIIFLSHARNREEPIATMETKMTTELKGSEFVEIAAKTVGAKTVAFKASLIHRRDTRRERRAARAI